MRDPAAFAANAARTSRNAMAMHHRRLGVSIGIGLAAGLLIWFYYTRYAPRVWSDFDQIWLGGRALLLGRDPYVEVPKAFPWPLYYPLPAVLIGLPFAPWSVLTSRILFAVLSATASAWAIFRYRPHAWPMLASAPFIHGLVRGQWAPLLVVGALIPAFGGVIAAKPSIGLATLAYRPTRIGILGAAALGLLALAVQPSWPTSWLVAARTAPHLIVPALMPGGIILLSALGRWRRPDARLLGVLACVPQTPSIYDLFPMALVPASLRQSLLLAVSWNMYYLVTLATHPSGPLTLAEVLGRHQLVYWPLTLLLAYLPALFCVLWPLPLVDRPRDFERWPTWRQRLYRVAWGSVLGLVASVTLLWAYLMWSRA